MPTDSAFIEMTPMDSTGRPVNHVSSSNAADHQGDGVRLTNLRPGAPRHAYIFLIRITQLVFVSIYLALLVHCVLHKGWWLYVDLPLGLGSKNPTFLLSGEPLTLWQPLRVQQHISPSPTQRSACSIAPNAASLPGTSPVLLILCSSCTGWLLLSPVSHISRAYLSCC